MDPTKRAAKTVDKRCKTECKRQTVQDVRPWLKHTGACDKGACISQVRQGTFGCSFRQYDLVAEHMT